MSGRVDTSDYVKGLTMAGLARAQAQAEAAQPGAQTISREDLERLQRELGAAQAAIRQELRSLRLATLTGIGLLCAAVLLLRL